MDEKTVIALVAMICITALELVALICNIDGAFFGVVVAAIAGLGGYTLARQATTQAAK